MTLTLTSSSSERSWPGLSSPSQMTVSAPEASDGVAQLLGLARTDVGLGVGLVLALHQPLEHLAAGRLGQRLELEQRGLRVVPAGVDAHEHDALEPELAVLDLGDVLEVGADAGDPPERVALLEVEALALEVVARSSSWAGPPSASGSRWIVRPRASRAGGTVGTAYGSVMESCSAGHDVATRCSMVAPRSTGGDRVPTRSGGPPAAAPQRARTPARVRSVCVVEGGVRRRDELVGDLLHGHHGLPCGLGIGPGLGPAEELGIRPRRTGRT